MGDGLLEIYQRDDGLFDWRLVAGNGEIIATSGGQGYTERNDAVEGAARVFTSDPVITLVDNEEG